MTIQPTPTSRPAGSKKLLWTGWVLTILPATMLLMSAGMKLAKPPEVVEGFAKLGWSEDLALALAIVELACTVVFLVPQTAVLGAILLTGYLGGATATHVRVGDPFFMPIVLGVVIWVGLALREPALWSMVPLRRRAITS